MFYKRFSILFDKGCAYRVFLSYEVEVNKETLKLKASCLCESFGTLEYHDLVGRKI